MTAALSLALTRTADALSRDGAWLQGSIAKDAEGNKIGWRGDAARCWCLWGALCRFAGGQTYTALNAIEAYIRAPLTEWNDAKRRSQREVVGMLRIVAARVHPLPEENAR